MEDCRVWRDISSQNVLEEVAHSYGLHQLLVHQKSNKSENMDFTAEAAANAEMGAKSRQTGWAIHGPKQKKQTKPLLGQSPRRYWPWPNPTPPNVYTKKLITFPFCFISWSSINHVGQLDRKPSVFANVFKIYQTNTALPLAKCCFWRVYWGLIPNSWMNS